jgi:DNA-binding MarR family transcriptional regulator
MPTPRPFKGTRLAIARALIAGPKPASAIAHEIEKPISSIFGLLRRMVDEGLLEVEPGEQRGVRYTLLDPARKALQELERGPEPPGLIRRGQRLLLVEAPPVLGPASEIVTAESRAGVILWAVKIAGGWLLGIDGANPYPCERLKLALEGVDTRSQELWADDVFSAEELVKRADWMREEIEQER